MAKEIMNDPDEFQSQIDDFGSCTQALDDSQFFVGYGNVRLKSIDRYHECLIELNNVIKEYNELSKATKISLDNVIRRWKNIDEKIAMGYSEGHSTGSF